ncbi:38932_t:CDS:2 [Gigaspora margarita]|uniref:38932_t:CDS:1 n=1 Tax=Gigaspora margarita TaxID=4874 RepID=A0ABN7V300_GIGMA|nr:38932_t:CDS:2 [Gigaspora margarita]
MARPSKLKKLQKKLIQPTLLGRILLTLAKVKGIQNEEGNSIINCLFAASAVSFENKKCTIYTGLSAQTRQRRNKALKDAAVGSLKIASFFSANNKPLAVDNKSIEDLNSVSGGESNDKNESDNEEILVVEKKNGNK